MGLKYSVVLDTLALSGDNVFEKPHEVLEAVREAGFDGVDLGASKEEYKKQLPEIVSIVRSLGLKTHAFLGAWGGWHAGEERDLASNREDVRAYAVNYGKECVDLAAEIGAPVFEICAAPGVSTYPVSKIPVEALEENFARSVTDLCRYAEDKKITVMIEPINRFEGHPGFINSLVDAARMVNRLGIGNLTVMGDLFHMNIEDVSMCDAIRAAGENLKLIHLADSNRGMPGTGHIDFRALVRTLTDVGFTGSMSLDCLPARPDMKTFLQGSIVYMKTLERVNELEKRVAQM